MMHYEYFELGWCDRASIKPSQLTKEAKTMLKQAYYSAYGVPGQAPGASNDAGGGFPWGTAVGLGLLGAGGAWAHGKWGNNSPFKGFSQSVDNNVITPVKNTWNRLTTNPFKEMGDMSSRVGNTAFLGSLSGVKNMSDLHGTKFYQQNAMDTTGNVAGLGLLGHGVGTLASKTQFMQDKLKSLPAAGQIGKWAPKFGLPLAIASQVGASSQLGGKISDNLGIENAAGRGLVQAGTLGASGLGAWGGMKAGARIGARGGLLGTLAGGALGFLGHSVVPAINGLWNMKNDSSLKLNEMNARASALKNEFMDAMQAKQFGNPNKLTAWYGMHQNPENLNMTIGQFKDNPELQNQIRDNAVNYGL